MGGRGSEVEIGVKEALVCIGSLLINFFAGTQLCYSEEGLSRWVVLELQSNNTIPCERCLRVLKPSPGAT